ncbi:unnamed protein product [Owenia fusiformis]|uniref:Uncharacterized protein n=1 Tax=Owenia fusiformis TaxID=6347 RepID=A0A8S4QES4_OWEFU|nr:unnamed protein product [Owenia fusiformis]
MSGDICPREEFCRNGTAAPQLCQAGYYLNSTGNDDVSDCELCTVGFCCAGSGNDVPTGLCSAVYYYPGGQDDDSSTGYNCKEATIAPLEVTLLSDVPLAHTRTNWAWHTAWHTTGVSTGFIQ